MARATGPRARPDPRRLDRGPRVDAARGEPAARRPRAARARRRVARTPLAGQGPHHQGGHRRVDRREVPDRHPGRRAARPGRGYDGLRKVRAPPDDDRLAGRRQPARRVQLRAGRLQGRCGLQGLQPPAPHGRHGHRPRRPPDHPRAGVSRGGAASTRAPAGRCGRQGHRGLPRRSPAGRRADAPAAHRHRRVRSAGRRAARLRDRPRRRGQAGSLARRTPDPGDAAPRRRGQRGDQVQHQPAHRPARHRRRRLRRRDRVVGRRADPEGVPRPRLRPARSLLADPVPELPRRWPSGRRGRWQREDLRPGLAGAAPARSYDGAARRPRGRRQHPHRPGHPCRCDQRRQRRARPARDAQALAATAAGDARRGVARCPHDRLPRPADPVRPRRPPPPAAAGRRVVGPRRRLPPDRRRAVTVGAQQLPARPGRRHRAAVLAGRRAPVRHRRRQQRAAAADVAAPRRSGRDAHPDRPDVPAHRLPPEGARRASAVAGRTRFRRHRRATVRGPGRRTDALPRRTPGPLGGLRPVLRVRRRWRAPGPRHRDPPGGCRCRHPRGDDVGPQRSGRTHQHTHRGPRRAVAQRPRRLRQHRYPGARGARLDAAGPRLPRR